MSVVNVMKSMIRFAVSYVPMVDINDYPTQQVDIMGKQTESVPWFPFGMHANTPVDNLSLAFMVGGQRGSLVTLPGSPDDRPKDLLPGEVALYHPATGSFIKFKATGNIDISTAVGGKVNITSTEVNVTTTGDVNVIAGGDVDVDATGDVEVTAVGNVDVAAVNVDVTATGPVTIDSTNVQIGNATTRKLIDERLKAFFDSHVHANAVGADTLAPTVSMTIASVATSETKAS